MRIGYAVVHFITLYLSLIHISVAGNLLSSGCHSSNLGNVLLFASRGCGETVEGKSSSLYWFAARKCKSGLLRLGSFFADKQAIFHNLLVKLVGHFRPYPHRKTNPLHPSDTAV